MEFLPPQEAKMTPEERAVHKKQAKRAAELFWEDVEEKGPEAGAHWVLDKGSKYPRLHITGEQYERIFREMLDERDWSAAADRLIDSIEAFAEASRGIVEKEEFPMVDEEEFQRRLGETGRYRGYVIVKHLTGEHVVEFKDIQHTRIARDTVLEVIGTSPRQIKNPSDVTGYTAELLVDAPGVYTGKQWLGTLSFVPEFATLEAEEKQMVGDIFCSLWRQKLAELYKNYGGKYDPHIYEAIRPEGPAAVEVREGAIRFMRKFMQRKGEGG